MTRHDVTYPPAPRQDALFRAIFERAAIGICLRDQEGRFVETNPAFQRMLGYTAAELEGMVFLAVTHPDDWSADWDLFQTLVSGQADAYRLEKRFVRKDGAVLWAQLTVSLIHDRDGDAAFAVSMVEDLTERKALEEQLRTLARSDSLTGLPNRVVLQERLDQLVAQAHRQRAQHVAVFFLDLDGFKAINDRFGHASGDAVLRVVAHRLQATLRPQDLVVRMGGDEFVMLVQDLPHADDATLIAERLVQALQTPIALAHQQVTVTTSIGIALSTTESSTYDVLVRQADAALYHAKANGKACAVLFASTEHDYDTMPTRGGEP